MTEALLREGTVELDGSFVFVLLFSSVYVSYSPLLGGLATQTAILVCNLVCHLVCGYSVCSLSDLWIRSSYQSRRGCVGDAVMRHAFSQRPQRVRLFLRSFVLYRPWIPGEHRRGICAVDSVAAHLRGFEEDSSSEVVFWIDELSIEFRCYCFIVEEHVLCFWLRCYCFIVEEHVLLSALQHIFAGLRSGVVFWIEEWSIEFGYHWLMSLMFPTTQLFHFRFAVTEQ